MGKWVKIAIVSLVTLSLVVGVVGTALADRGVPGGQGRHGGGAGLGLAFGGFPESVGGLLGLTPEEIATQRHEGKSLAEIAANAPQPADETTLVNAIVAERQKVVDQRVADGKLTADQAAQVMERVRDQVSEMVNRAATGPNRSTDRPRLGLNMGRHGCFGDDGDQRGAGYGNCPWGNQAATDAQ